MDSLAIEYVNPLAVEYVNMVFEFQHLKFIFDDISRELLFLDNFNYLSSTIISSIVVIDTAFLSNAIDRRIFRTLMRLPDFLQQC